MEIKERAELIKKAIIPFPETNIDYECVICYQNKEITEIHLHSSLIQKFYLHGNKRDVCPLKLNTIYIEKLFKAKASERMIKGNFFETLCLGSTADGTGVWDLPKNRTTGKMTVGEQRIRRQAELFEMVCSQHNIIVTKNGPNKNVQISHKILWPFKKEPDIKIWIHATADLISPVTFNGWKHDVCIIDLKLPGDINNTFGEYCWGNMERMDLLQGVLYSRIYNIPFMYLLFDYKKESMWRPEPVNTNINHSDPIMANKANLRIREMEQTIDNLTEDLISYEINGWYPYATKENCSDCLNIYCEYHGKVFET